MQQSQKDCSSGFALISWPSSCCTFDCTGHRDHLLSLRPKITLEANNTTRQRIHDVGGLNRPQAELDLLIVQQIADTAAKVFVSQRYHSVTEAWFRGHWPAAFSLPSLRPCNSTRQAFALAGMCLFHLCTPVLRNRATAPRREVPGASESSDRGRTGATGRFSSQLGPGCGPV